MTGGIVSLHTVNFMAASAWKFDGTNKFSFSWNCILVYLKN